MKTIYETGASALTFEASGRGGAAEGRRFHLDRARLADLAEMALEAARRGGATYADIRLGETHREYAFARDDRLENFDERDLRGFGLRVLRDGSWGFYGAGRLDPESVTAGVERALDNARAVRAIQAQPIILEALPAHEAEWIMPMTTDPFAVDAGRKSDLLLSICAAARDNGADFCTATLSLAREERFFANSRGARIHQTRTRVAPGFTAAAIDRGAGRVATRDSLTPARGAGWEYLENAGLLTEAAQAGAEARAKLGAKTVAPGDYDIVSLADDP